MPDLVDLADAKAEMIRVLGSSATRRQHVRGVARTAANACRLLRTSEIVVSAAWLHDIGYAPELAATGLHSLDGARYLRTAGAEDRICRLVANHTHAWLEAEGRGLAEVLAAEFPAEHSLTADVLTYADLTTSPTGESIGVEARIAEILRRYPSDDVVHCSIANAAPELIATVRRVEAALAAAQPR
ncbi:HD domain-containing protein [uncultured Cellulomonas sp.]|uniref:HD domain-containing protein n=1 Tax=uncultured Cellulomonas sp. TaxID=189682 RepID=UPI0028E36EDB|nr:HD domain-containing protein [uncultured Cellulomonas sp.]